MYDQPFIEEHADHIGKLMTEGRIVLSGPFTWGARNPASPLGMSIVRAADEAGLRTWLAKDPAIVHEVVTAELHPLQIVFQGRDTDKGGRSCHHIATRNGSTEGH
jgi:uncharacterized protein YciI